MKICRAKAAGFCMGVSLAISRLENALNGPDAHCKRIVMYGPIIHNPNVLKGFMQRGVALATSPEELEANDIVVIRAHGLPQHEEARLQATGATVLDATCPKVKKAQLSIAEATADGAPLWLFGEENHPEVQGLVSYAHGACHVFASSADLTHTPFPAADLPFVLAAQTTQEHNVFMQFAKEFTAHNPAVRVLSTICNATEVRQKETMDIARNVDMMVIVGGRESGNTRRLAAVAHDQGTPTFLIEDASELPPADVFCTASSIGLSAGASTPYALIDEVQEKLALYGVLS